MAFCTEGLGAPAVQARVGVMVVAQTASMLPMVEQARPGVVEGSRP